MNDYPSSLEITVDPPGTHEQYRLVKFRGALDKVGLELVRKQIEELVDTVEKESAVVFDCENLEFLNSESIGFLLMLQARLLKKEKKLVLVHPSQSVKDVLEVIGMFKILDYYDSLEDFEKHL